MKPVVIEADPLAVSADVLVHGWNRNLLSARWFDHRGLSGEIRLRGGEPAFAELAKAGG